MGFVITQATATCDKCKAAETVTSNVLPEGWTRVRKANNSVAILCAADTEALNSFFS
jgi:hypothetical protein